MQNMLRGIPVTILLCALAGALQGQQIISTFAGTQWVFPSAPRPALNAPFSSLLGTTLDPQGRLVITDGLNHVVTRLETTGEIRVIAGSGVAGFSGDGGDALRAALNGPQSVAYDLSGNLYISDTGNRRIRRVSPAGIISTVAGRGVSTPSNDGGPATAAGLRPGGIAVDASGVIFFTDFAANRVRRVGTDGIISNFAGTGAETFSGPGRQARDTAMSPEALHIDRQGRLLISDTTNYYIYRVGTDGVLTVVAGNGRESFSGDGGAATSAGVANVTSVTTDSIGNILFADTNNRRIRRVDTSGVIRTIAGGGETDVLNSPVPALNAAIGFPDGVVADRQGRVLFANVRSQHILALSADGQSLSRIAGDGLFKELRPGTPAALVWMTRPSGITVGPDGSVYYAEQDGHRVARVAPGGLANQVAGNGVASCCLDGGPATSGRVTFPNAVAFAPDGALLIADGGNDLIRRIQNGVITSIAGIPFETGFSGDGGAATSARLKTPWGLAVDPQGNIYFSDQGNNRVRRIDTRGVITTIAGTGARGYSGDGGLATAATLNSPYGVALTPSGDLLICDFGNNRIRAVSPAGTIRTFAGNGTEDYAGDGGPATQAAVDGPIAVATDRTGNVYISHYFSVIRRVAPNGIISTIAGVDRHGFEGDGGSPLEAALNRPFGLAADAAGNLFIADTFNDRIRVIRSLSVTSTLAPGTVNIAATAGAGTTTPVRIALTSSVSGIPFTSSVAYGQTPGGWLMVNASGTNAPATLTLTANASGLAAGRYTATLTIATNPAGAANPVSVVLTVTDSPAVLSLSSDGLTFTRNEGTTAVTSVLEVRNSGGGTLAYQLSATTAAQPAWLRASLSSGSLRAGEVASVNITADPTGLRAGTFLGSIVVTSGAVRRTVPVTMTVRGVRRTILVSQSGLTFTSVAGGGSPTPQKIGILNTGSGVLNWRATTSGRFSRLSASAGTVTEPWLEVSDLEISIAPAGLSAGQYYDRIEISGDADNSPQIVTVLLNVLPEGTNPGPEVTPSGMIFIAKQGENPGAQRVTFNNLGRTAVTFDSSRLGNWYESVPGAGRAVPDGPGSVIVQPALATLSPGVRRGVVTFQVQEDGSIRTVNLLSVVAPPDTGAKDGRGAASCAAPTLRVESTSMRDGFSVRVGEAVTVEVKASDECGNLLTPLAGGTGAQVIARPENGDPQVPLAHIGNGVWRGTWRPVRATANTRISIVAIFLGTAADVVAGRTQAGKVEMSGAVLAQGATAAPLMTAGGVVHSASFEGGVPVAPGSLITVYGARLADATGTASSVPLPSALNGTQVKLGNRALPLLFTSDGQLNAQVPYDVPVDTQHQLTVERGETIGVPETINVASAKPGIFTRDQTGSGQGAIVRQDGVTLAQPGTPAARGEVAIIYCSGLGPVTPEVIAGRPAPSSPLSSVVNPVSVTIGGQNAQVLFAGLAPGFSGLYQVNAIVPAQSATGDTVEVTIEVAGQRSRAVTIAVR